MSLIFKYTVEKTPETNKIFIEFEKLYVKP